LQQLTRIGHSATALYHFRYTRFSVHGANAARGAGDGNDAAAAGLPLRSRRRPRAVGMAKKA
jgi:hypothetical protein